MPVYNVDRFIVAAIQSVLDQNYPNLELFIFNDGSTDKTLEEIQTFLEKRPDLKAVVHLKSTTNNQGVSQTRTELIKWSKSFNPQAQDNIISQCR